MDDGREKAGTMSLGFFCHHSEVTPSDARTGLKRQSRIREGLALWPEGESQLEKNM
jgi:hypothetical protein